MSALIQDRAFSQYAVIDVTRCPGEIGTRLTARRRDSRNNFSSPVQSTGESGLSKKRSFFDYGARGDESRARSSSVSTLLNPAYPRIANGSRRRSVNPASPQRDRDLLSAKSRAASRVGARRGGAHRLGSQSGRPKQGLEEFADGHLTQRGSPTLLRARRAQGLRRRASRGGRPALAPFLTGGSGRIPARSASRRGRGPGAPLVLLGPAEAGGPCGVPLRPLARGVNLYERAGLTAISDSCDDNLAHIVGLGRTEFRRNMESPRLIRERERTKIDYKESFAYCIPFEEDYDLLTDEGYEGFIRSATAVIDRLNATDPDDVPPKLYRRFPEIREVCELLQRPALAGSGCRLPPVLRRGLRRRLAGRGVRDPELREDAGGLSAVALCVAFGSSRICMRAIAMEYDSTLDVLQRTYSLIL